MPVFATVDELQAHRLVSQRVHDLHTITEAAARIEQLLTGTRKVAERPIVAGKEASMSDLGQLVLVHSTGFWARLIQLVQGLENPPELSRWNHVAIIVSDTEMVEEAPRGARVVPIIGSYAEYVVSAFPLTERQRLRASAWAVQQAKRRTKYGYLDLWAIGVSLILKDRTPRWLLREMSDGRSYQCAAFVDMAYRIAGAHLFRDDRPVAAVYPASIAGLFEEAGWI